MEERTERAAAVKKKKAEKNALVDSEPRSSRNGHTASRPSNIEPSQFSSRITHHHCASIFEHKEVLSPPIRPQATVVLLPPINHRECRMVLMMPVCHHAWRTLQSRDTGTHGTMAVEE